MTQEKNPPRTVDLNRAQIEELVALPGIGEIVARRIVTYREEVVVLGSTGRVRVARFRKGKWEHQ